jgi:hypothetical protein
MSNGGAPKNLYKIVESDNRGTFNDEATELLRKGYEPVGGIFVYLKDNKSTYVQGFWRPDYVAVKAPA